MYMRNYHKKYYNNLTQNIKGEEKTKEGCPL